jgi:hypothetical protein
MYDKRQGRQRTMRLLNKRQLVHVLMLHYMDMSRRFAESDRRRGRPNGVARRVEEMLECVALHD